MRCDYPNEKVTIQMRCDYPNEKMSIQMKIMTIQMKVYTMHNIFLIFALITLHIRRAFS